MAYATAADLITRYDRNLIADLAGDDGTPADPLTSARVAAALEAASGEIDAACRLGGRYLPSELAALGGADAAFLRDITCQLAMLRLVGVRVQSIGELAYKTLRDMSDKVIDDLRSGRMIFGTPAAERAVTPAVDGPSAIDYDRLNLLPERTRNYYPNRQSRLPLGR
jgi:phage gp36-like protein